MRRRALSVGSLGLMLAAASAGLDAQTAQAALPTCTGAPARVYSFPERLAWKTPVAPGTSVDDLSARNWPSNDGTVSFTFGPADPKGKVSHPFSYSWVEPYIFPARGPNVLFERGDGPGLLTWTYTESVDDYGGAPECQRVIQTISQPIRGTIPRLKVGFRSKWTGAVFAVFSWGRLCRKWETSAVAPMRLTVSMLGSRRTVTKRDQCGVADFGPLRQRGRGFVLSTDGFDRAYLNGIIKQPGTYPIRYRYRFGRKKVESGRLTMTVRVRRFAAPYSASPTEARQTVIEPGSR